MADAVTQQAKPQESDLEGTRARCVRYIENNHYANVKWLFRALYEKMYPIGANGERGRAGDREFARLQVVYDAVGAVCRQIQALMKKARESNDVTQLALIQINAMRLESAAYGAAWKEAVRGTIPANDQEAVRGTMPATDLEPYLNGAIATMGAWAGQAKESKDLVAVLGGDLDKFIKDKKG